MREGEARGAAMGTAAMEGEELAVMEAPHRRSRPAAELCTGGVAATELRVGVAEVRCRVECGEAIEVAAVGAERDGGSRGAYQWEEKRATGGAAHEDGRGKWTVVTEMVAPWRWPWMRKGGDRLVVVNCVVRCSTDYGYCIGMIMAEGG
ncbi:type VI secretion system ATPase TssH [Sesbania bispinosa]|nr:type VI secretion system ATPase TssH [Sesbania bispinosa]